MASLALHPGQDQPRSALASAFWPDSTDEQALTNLRRELHALRGRVPEFPVNASGRLVRWDLTDGVRCDVAEFVIASMDAATLTAQSDTAGCVQAAESAVASYSGELLPAWTDEWLL